MSEAEPNGGAGNTGNSDNTGNSGSDESKGIRLGGSNPENNQDKGGAGGDDPFSGLSEEHQALAKEKGWTSFDDALKSYTEAQNLISRGDHKKSGSEDGNDDKGGDGGNAGNQSFQESDYQFNKPTDFETIGYNDEFAKTFKGWAHAAGLDPKVAAQFHDNFVDWSRGELKGQASVTAEASQTRAREAEVGLKQEWGKPGTDGFNRQLELSQRAVRELGFDTNALGVTIDSDGDAIITNADFFLKMAKIGNAMYAEDTVFGDPTHGGAENPFDPKSKAFNVTAQGKLVRDNPDVAVTLIQSLPEDVRKRYTRTLESAQRRAK